MLFETNRTYARLLSMDDSEDYYHIKGDIRITSGYGMDAYSKDKSDKKLASLIEIEEKDAYSVAIIEKESNKLIGSICLWNLDRQNNMGELGYEFAYEYLHQGYGYECVNAFMKYMHDNYGYVNFSGVPYEYNYASNRLLLKLGFVLDKVIEENNNKLNYYRKVW